MLNVMQISSQGNRKNYAEDSVSIIKRQRSTIEKIKRDNEGLRREIAAMGKVSGQDSSTRAALNHGIDFELCETMNDKVEGCQETSPGISVLELHRVTRG